MAREIGVPTSPYRDPTGSLEGSRDTDEGIVVSTEPDICLTPSGGTMVPVGYNICAKQADDARTTPTVKLTSLRSHNMASLITTCHGDEAGTGGGVKSGTHNGICEPKGHSATVYSEGQQMIRHTDEWWMNNKNTVGKLNYVKDAGDHARWFEAKAQVAEADTGVKSDASPQAAASQPVSETRSTWQKLDTLAAGSLVASPADGEAETPPGWILIAGTLVYIGLRAWLASKSQSIVRTTGESDTRKRCKCIVGSYDAIKGICGPLCGQQAHHIVPDYALRYGNRAEGMVGVNRIPGMPSFGSGAAICLEGNAGDPTTEHGEAHGADAQISALGAGSSYYPAGTAPIGAIKIRAEDQVKAIKDDGACMAEIDKAVDASFAGVNNNTLGRTTADNWPAVGSEAYKALSTGMSATLH